MLDLLFSTDTDSGTITVLRADGAKTEKICSIPVGNGPRGAVKFTKQGRGYVTNHAGNTISEIDAYSLREIDRITVGIAPIGLTIVPGDRYALVSNAGENDVSVVDLEAREEVHRVPVGREPRHPDTTPDGRFSYIPISGSDSVSKIDVSALTKGHCDDLNNIREVARIYLGQDTMPYSVGVSPDGNYAVAANNQAEFVSIIDVTSDKIIHQVEVGAKGARGSAFSPDGDITFVTIEDSSEIIAIELHNGKIIDRFKVGPGPRGIFLDPGSGTIFCSAFARQTASVSRANSISVLHFPEGFRKLTAERSKPVLNDVGVGAGPCSVSMFVGA